MRAKAVQIRAKNGDPVVDTCGTGGDGRERLISPRRWPLWPLGWMYCRQHENRSVSSQCGSADVLETLGSILPFLLKRRSGACKNSVWPFFSHPHSPCHKARGDDSEGDGYSHGLQSPRSIDEPGRSHDSSCGIYRRDLIRPVAEVLRTWGARQVLLSTEKITAMNEHYRKDLCLRIKGWSD